MFLKDKKLYLIYLHGIFHRIFFIYLVFKSGLSYKQIFKGLVAGNFLCINLRKFFNVLFRSKVGTNYEKMTNV